LKCITTKKLLSKFFVADLYFYVEIIVELKAVSRFLAEHEAQIIDYLLNSTKNKLGLLINFGTDSLEYTAI